MTRTVTIQSAIAKAFDKSDYPLEYNPAPNPKWFSKNANGIEFCNQFVEVADGYEVVRLGELLEGFAEFSSAIGNAQQAMSIDIQMQRRAIFLDLIQRFGFDDATGAEIALGFCLTQTLRKRPEVFSDAELAEVRATPEQIEEYKKRVAEAQEIYDKAIAIINEKRDELISFAQDRDFEPKIKQLVTMQSANPSQRFADLYHIAVFLKGHCKYRYEDLPDGAYEPGEVEKYLTENKLLNLDGTPRRTEVDLDIPDIMNFPRKRNEKLIEIVGKDIQGAPLVKATILENATPKAETSEELEGNLKGSKRQKVTSQAEVEPQTTMSLLQAA
jgi:tetratricopeptide (TPR) repeat protein